MKLLKSWFNNIECNPNITSALRYTLTQVLHGLLINNIKEHIPQKLAGLTVVRHTSFEQWVPFFFDNWLYVFHAIGLEEKHTVSHGNSRVLLPKRQVDTVCDAYNWGTCQISLTLIPFLQNLLYEGSESLLIWLETIDLIYHNDLVRKWITIVFLVKSRNFGQ